MHDGPKPEEMLAAVTAFLRDELLPTLDGRLRFQTRVAANAIDLVKRQLTAGVALDEQLRLEALVGEKGPVIDLTRLLATRIRDGQEIGDGTGLAHHLWQTSVEKIMVDQPDYAGYPHALRLQAGESSESGEEK